MKANNNNKKRKNPPAKSEYFQIYINTTHHKQALQFKASYRQRRNKLRFNWAQDSLKT